jgi:hypothetical protein
MQGRETSRWRLYFHIHRQSLFQFKFSTHYIPEFYWSKLKWLSGKRVHGKRVQCSFVTLINTWRFYWKSSCRPSDCVNDGQTMASVKDNFTVDYVIFSTFIVFQHASRKSSRISNHLTLLSDARKIMPLVSAMNIEDILITHSETSHPMKKHLKLCTDLIENYLLF